MAADKKFGHDYCCLSCHSARCAKRHRDKRADLFDKYGITKEQYESMMVLQGGACAICGNQFDRTPNVDHDHETGWVRALLCYLCNSMIGLAKESPETLDRAAAYLRSHRC